MYSQFRTWSRCVKLTPSDIYISTPRHNFLNGCICSSILLLYFLLGLHKIIISTILLFLFTIYNYYIDLMLITWLNTYCITILESVYMVVNFLDIVLSKRHNVYYTAMLVLRRKTFHNLNVLVVLLSQKDEVSHLIGLAQINELIPVCFVPCI
jgi:hypothetical protein